MKRSNENGDIRKEDVEALDEESTEAGTWQAASKEELATRKIIKIVRKSTGNESNMHKNPATVTNDSNSTNPFANFSIPKANVSASNSFISEAAVSNSNPFAHLTFPPTSTFTVKANQASAPPLNTATNSNLSEPSSRSLLSSAIGVETEYMKKMKKLNESFLLWAERQVKEKALAVWKDGVKDYIKYQTNLKEKFGNDVSTNTDLVSTGETVQFNLQSKPMAITTSLPANANKPQDLSLPPNHFNFEVPPKVRKNDKEDLNPGLTSFSSFNFKLPETTPSANPAPFKFNLPASTPFNFNLPTNPPSSNLPASAGAFSFSANTLGGTNSISNGFGFSSTGTAQGEGDDGEGDEEGEPILPPEKILKNENDTDEILLEVPCKLFGFNAEEKEWKDIGKGSFRVTKDPTTEKKRMLVRNTMGKITFNAAFYKEMKIDLVKGGFTLLAVVAQVKDPSKTDLKAFMFKLKDSDISQVKKFLEDIVNSL